MDKTCETQLGPHNHILIAICVTNSYDCSLPTEVFIILDFHMPMAR